VRNEAYEVFSAACQAETPWHTDTLRKLGAQRPGVWYESRIDMSKKAGFLDMFLGYVQDVDMSVPELIWL
jgi:hypothetical protein